MSSKTIEILAAAPLIVKTPTGDIAVHELTWLELLGFVEKLSASAGQFIEQGENGPVLNLAKLADIVRKSGELIADLVSKSARLHPDKIASLSPRAVLAIADAALQINATPELFAAGNAVAGRFAQVLRPVPAASAA
jgi:hypothetical protein